MLSGILPIESLMVSLLILVSSFLISLIALLALVKDS